MFNWQLFFIIFILCVPGNLVMSYKAIPGLKKKIVGQSLPSDRNIFLLLFVQNLVLSVIAAAIGTAIASRVGLKDALLLNHVVQGIWSWQVFGVQVTAGIIGGVICAFVWLTYYYFIARKNDLRVNIVVQERIRREIGLSSRVLSGGIVEEVMFRWGLLLLLLWIGSFISGDVTPLIFWASIIISGVIFGWAHIPGYVAEGCVKTKYVWISGIIGNLWVTAICGWLFWHYGLLSAIIVHMLFHLLWYPFERYTFAKEKVSDEEIDALIGQTKPAFKQKNAELSFPNWKDIIQTEKRVYGYAFMPRKMKKEKDDHTDVFTYHQNSGYLAVVIMMIHALVLEAIAVHLLLAIWSDIAAWLFTASSVYLIIFLLGDYNAVRLSPIRMNEDSIYISTGFRNKMTIPFEKIASIGVFKRDEQFQKLKNKEKERYRAVNAVLLEMNQDTPLINITFTEPIEFIGYYGAQKHLESIYLSVDEHAKFLAMLTAALEKKDYDISLSNT